MKTKLINIACAAIAVISFSCSSDSDSENNNQNDMFLDKTEEFTPQQSGFTSRIVSYFENNKKVKDTTFNAAGAMNSRRDYVYTSTTLTSFRYNAQNILTSKYVNTYDSAKRIINVESYDGQNQLIYSREYQYIGHDINLYSTTTGTPELIANFKTNADNLVYYQENFSSEEIRTMSYNNDLPTQMVQGDVTMSYQFYPNMKPQNIQNTTNEINNTALLLVLDHVYFSCNYYLNTVFFPPINTTAHYDRTFNENNYQTYLKMFVDYDGTIQNSSETFFYYN